MLSALILTEYSYKAVPCGNFYTSDSLDSVLSY